ncbi:hypothetical protein FBUS_00440 [Fasciolopsis buskii]|uniref:Uncharacterized protein n=1 Tax=Fasciolopsis buskii TaxID=27845 RepID=A0A8E0S9R7_9TREM|nr:hypothetical protein FBUS_00440 [Fasciolopsis buski]
MDITAPNTTEMLRGSDVLQLFLEALFQPVLCAQCIQLNAKLEANSYYGLNAALLGQPHSDPFENVHSSQPGGTIGVWRCKRSHWSDSNKQKITSHRLSDTDIDSYQQLSCLKGSQFIDARKHSIVSMKAGLQHLLVLTQEGCMSHSGSVWYWNCQTKPGMDWNSRTQRKTCNSAAFSGRIFLLDTSEILLQGQCPIKACYFEKPFLSTFITFPDNLSVRYLTFSRIVCLIG